MDPALSAILSPFLPMATIVVALVGLLREAWPTIDGKRVLLAAAVASVLVTMWSQLRSGPPMDWLKVIVDAPIIFIISAGGTKVVQRLQDRKAKADAEAAAAPVAPAPPADVAPPVVVELPAPSLDDPTKPF